MTDLSYVASWASVADVCFLINAYSRRVVGWRVASRMRIWLHVWTSQLPARSWLAASVAVRVGAVGGDLVEVEHRGVCQRPGLVRQCPASRYGAAIG